MKKANVLKIILEAIVILGSFVIGGTILMYNILDYSITRTLIGLIILSVGLIGIVEFVASRIEIKLKNIQSFIVYSIGMVVGRTGWIIRRWCKQPRGCLQWTVASG